MSLLEQVRVTPQDAASAGRPHCNRGCIACKISPWDLYGSIALGAARLPVATRAVDAANHRVAPSARLGVAQIADGVVALPLDARTAEQLEWLAEEVVENGGEATVWLAEPGSAAQERKLAAQMAAAVAAEYAQSSTKRRAAARRADGVRRRTLARLRRELRRIGSRDYFPRRSPNGARARRSARRARSGRPS